MSRTLQRARSSFYRTPGALRLTSVVTMLLVVGMLMYRASDPRNWVWLTGEPRESVTPVATVSAGQPAAEIVTPGPTDADAEERGAAREQFQAISDRTLALGREEMPAYWRLFAWSEHQSFNDLAQRSDPSSVLDQFLQTPDEQRGKLFKLELNVRRIRSYPAPANSAGVENVYELWGWTTESKAWLYEVVTAHLPPGMPIGPNVNERVTFAGYFLKVQAYLAAGAGPKDKPLAAPLLVGRIAWQPPPAAAATDGGWTQGVIMLVVILGALGLAVWMFIPRRAATPRRVIGSSERPSTERGDVHQWLAQAQGETAGNNSPKSEFPFHNN